MGSHGVVPPRLARGRAWTLRDAAAAPARSLGDPTDEPITCESSKASPTLSARPGPASTPTPPPPEDQRHQVLEVSLERAAPGASFVLWEDPAGDWLGDLCMRAPSWDPQRRVLRERAARLLAHADRAADPASQRPAQTRLPRHSAPRPGRRWASRGPVTGRPAAGRTRQPIRRGDRVK
jgi:hypothetical protein